MQRRTQALLVGLAAGLAAAGALLLRGCGPGPDGSAGEIGEAIDGPSEAAATGAPLEPAAPPARVRGAVMVEVGGAVEAAPPPSQAPGEKDMVEGTGPDGYDPSALDKEPGADGPPVPLAPPRECKARAWRDGFLLAEAACDAAGAFQLDLALPAGPAAAVTVEVLVPGHLRGVLTAPAQAGTEAVLPTLALGPASWLKGQVIDRRGQPVGGVKIEATPLPGLGEPEPWRVDSDAAGAFVLDTVPGGPLRLRASGQGLALSVVEAFAPEAGVVIVVDSLQDLSGTVLGDPALVARAEVRLEGSSLWPPLVQKAGPGGEFLFGDLVDGVYGLVAQVRAQQPGEQEYASIPLENLSPGGHVSLALIAAQRVPVQVVSPDGSPVARARVTLGYASVGLLQQVAEADDAGLADLGPVVPGPYVVRADADGYLPSESLAVDVGATALARQTLTLVRPGRITGTVIDDDGRPVPGASIMVDADTLYSPGEAMIRARTFSALQRGGSLGVTRGTVPPIPLVGEGEAVGTWAETDERGDFSLDTLMPGRYRLRAVHGDHAGSATAIVDLSPGEREDGIVLTLGHGVPLGGRVLDGNRQPIAGARIELADGSEVTSDGFGMWSAGHRRGKQRVVIRAAGMVPAVVEVDLENQATSIEQVLLPAEGALEGRVRDGNDQAIAGVRVTLLPAGELAPTEVTWTDARGLFEFSRLVPGTATLELDHPEYAPASKRVKVDKGGRPAAPVELALARGWSLEVVVRAVGSGDPIAGARVEVDGQVWAADEAGEVRAARLARERVRVKVEAPGWVGVSTSFVRPQGLSGTLVLDLDEAAGLDGEVTDERGEPVGGARLIVRTRDGSTVLAETTTDTEGRWSVEGLPEGDVSVEAIPPPGLAELLAPVTLRTDVRRGHVTREVDLRFDRL
ncbi:carboxypeptidase-like regulatory domain-containing protein [Nannocystis radixulma]|uniref:Carboxypeptidase-like regulatory domain-containing protein n=1 Tax=Nannocystis radixulma TaxID=2995305 RepID=A0ABT5B9P7_9BACT|nr:carboxypeptidase-like regulatory domain-containing protein [Nannocystis radixulma]MDC0670865.1 carboxypeptidase-like regulatory domain-containing protein [Nannocystis radixulma]